MTLDSSDSSSAADRTSAIMSVNCYKIELKRFNYTEYKHQDIEDHVNPDNNFYSDFINNCCYNSVDQFNRTVQAENKISNIHFNSRSLYANFN